MAARLVCGICRGSYKTPKILSCFHSFCEACTDSLIAKAKPDPKFQCPLCSMDIDIPEGGARFLQNNFYIKMVEEKKVADEKLNVSCENCDDEKRPEAIKYCTACQQKICENCVLLHGKLKATKSHELVNVDHVNNLKSHERLCVKHEKKVAGSYCQNCEEFVCATCRDEGHEQHFIEDTDIAATRRKKDIEKSLLESETYLGLVQHRLERMTQNLMSLVKAHEEKAVDELEKTANAWKENIDSGMKASSLKVEQLCKKELSEHRLEGMTQNIKSLVKAYEIKAMEELEKMANAWRESIDSEMKASSIKVEQLYKKELYELDVIEKSMISTSEKHELTKKWILHASNDELLAEGARMQRKIFEVNFSLPSYIPPLNVITLAEARNTVLSLSADMNGVVSTKKIPNVGGINLELVTSFYLPSNNQILFILPYKGTQVWMAQQDINGLVMYKEDGTKKDEMMTTIKISAVGLDCDLDLLACIDGEMKISKISGDRTLSTFCTLKKVPGLIAVCPDGRVVVCERNAKKLIIFNGSGTKTPWTQKNTNSFNSVQCIAVCKYTNILAVVDRKAQHNRAKYQNDQVTVYLFDHRGQTVNIFEKNQIFCIVSDNRGHFLLGCNNVVIIIDVRGNKLADFICMQHSFCALSLAVDTVNQLWIGGNGSISIFKYLDASISTAKT